MIQVRKGKYYTRCGLVATVARIKTAKGRFFAQGVIHDTVTGVLGLHQWNIEGRSLAPTTFSFDYDLMAELE